MATWHFKFSQDIYFKKRNSTLKNMFPHYLSSINIYILLSSIFFFFSADTVYEFC